MQDGDGAEDATSRRRLLRAAGTAAALGVTGLSGTAAADDRYGDPEYPSEAWFAREQANVARTREEPLRQATDPAFQERWNEQSVLNSAEFRRQQVEETGWNRRGNACREFSRPCSGDPYMYPATEPVWRGDPFYEETGDVQRVAFYDSGLDLDEGGARISGRVWAPKDSEPGDDLPGVVITNGSIEASETMYWWAAQAFVANGYVAMTYDPRGQGRSDNQTPEGTEGGEQNESVFVTNQVDAVDLFRSTPDDPYPHNEGRERDDHEVAPVVDHNPFHDRVDRDRIAVAGHSAGARAVSVVQGLDPWPETARGDENPVDVGLAWDHWRPEGYEFGGRTVEPRVPVMGHSADYGIEPVPKTEPPDPEARNAGYNSWHANGVPAFQVTVRGGSHLEWSRVPSFPASDWESWGNELAEHYSVAWVDFWLKEPGEPGYDDAESRLLESEPWHERLSFYYRSAYSFPSSPDAAWPVTERPPSWNTCEDVEDGC